jgi:hypothetical protein
MDQPPYSMDEPRRTAVLSAMIDRCAHVRTNHIHLVIDSDATPERVMNDLKSFASRRLNELGLDGADRKRWARHGSTRYLWKREDMPAALSYVLDKQGEQMAVYSAPEP